MKITRISYIKKIFFKNKFELFLFILPTVIIFFLFINVLIILDSNYKARINERNLVINNKILGFNSAFLNDNEILKSSDFLKFNNLKELHFKVKDEKDNIDNFSISLIGVNKDINDKSYYNLIGHSYYDIEIINGLDINDLNENEIILNENIVEKYNLNLEQVFKYSTINKKTQEYKIKGIYRYTSKVTDSFFNNIGFTKNNKKASEYDYFFYNIKDYQNLVNYIKNETKRNVYTGLDELNNINSDFKNVKNSSFISLFFVIIIILTINFITIFYILKRNYKAFFVLKALGVDNKLISMDFSIIYLLLTFLSLVISIILSVITIYLIDFKNLGIPFSLSINYLNLFIIIFTTIITTTILLYISVYLLLYKLKTRIE